LVDDKELIVDKVVLINREPYGTGTEGDDVKKGLARFPYNRQLRRICKQCGGTSISEYNLRRRQETM
jgi:hypothetical protein